MPQTNDQSTTRAPKLAVVIHTEEEFDWGKGFFRSKNQVNHGQALIDCVEKILAIGAKVVFAMDYAFVDSEEGQKVIDHFKERRDDTIEFATHVHPWVNPPYDSDVDQIDARYSFPGNLPREMEYEKIRTLTDLIEKKAGRRPTTYLAGRFGIGNNSYEILRSLGYEVDLSISSYIDMRASFGPDFSHFSNAIFEKQGLTHIPHTAGIVSLIPFLTSYLNRHPPAFTKVSRHPLLRTLAKTLRIQRLRLSPEDYSLQQMKRLTLSQIALGQNVFVFSFHSPTVAPGNTEYVKNAEQQRLFVEKTCEYLEWYQSETNGEFSLSHQLSAA